MILANFSGLNRRNVNDYSELYEDIKATGYVIFNLVGRIGVWAILNALLMLGYFMATKGENVNERNELKGIIMKVLIVSLILLNVAGFVGCVLGAGLDMF